MQKIWLEKIFSWVKAMHWCNTYKAYASQGCTIVWLSFWAVFSITFKFFLIFEEDLILTWRSHYTVACLHICLSLDSDVIVAIYWPLASVFRRNAASQKTGKIRHKHVKQRSCPMIYVCREESLHVHNLSCDILWKNGKELCFWYRHNCRQKTF